MEQDDRNEELVEESDFGFARVYSVELIYREKPQLHRETLFSLMEQYTGKLALPEEGEEEEETEESEAGIAVWEANEEVDKEMLHFFHLNHKVQYADGEMPAQTSLMEADYSLPTEYKTAIEQAWHWPEAEQTLQECSHSLLLIDMMASGLEPKARLELCRSAAGRAGNGPVRRSLFPRKR